jgi:hypothetical protein
MNGDVYVHIYAAKRYFKVETEGNRDEFFITEDNPIGEFKEVEENPTNQFHPANVAKAINQTNFDDDDIHALRAFLEVDSDNDPASECTSSKL